MARRLVDLLGFAPLAAFLVYAAWDGPPDEPRWQTAYRLAGVLAAARLAAALALPGPANRVALGADAYLIVGSALAWVWLPGLRVFGGELRESGVLLTMFIVGLAAAVFTQHGYACVHSPRRARRASLVLLAVTAAAAAFSLHFRGDRLLAGVLPITGVALANWVLSWEAA